MSQRHNDSAAVSERVEEEEEDEGAVHRRMDTAVSDHTDKQI